MIQGTFLVDAMRDYLLSVCLLLCLLGEAKRGAWAFSLPTPGKVTALVTGANRGLGLAISQVLAQEEGHHIIMTSRKEAEGRWAADHVRETTGGSVSYLKLDVTQLQDIRSVAAYVQQKVAGGLDLLVNNAGICIRDDASVQALRESLQVNAFGSIRLMEHLLPSLRVGRGAVINVSSGDGELAYLHTDIAKDLESLDTMEDWEAYLQGFMMQPHQQKRPSTGQTFHWAHDRPLQEVSHLPWPAYSLSKAALNAATRIWAKSAEVPGGVGGGGISVKAVCPGDVLTDMCDVDMEEVREGGALLLSPLEAARDVVWVAQQRDLCPGGHFYRSRNRISW